MMAPATMARDLAQALTQLQELTGGFGVHSVLECVGTEQAIATSMAIVRPGGA